MPLLRSRISFYRLNDYYEDAFSVGLETIYNAILSFKEGEFLFYTFVLSCLNNRLITYYKETSREKEKNFKMVYDYLNDVSISEKKKICLSDNHIFYGLDNSENTLVKMRYYLNFSYKEIADLTGNSVYKVTKTIENAVKKIKNNVIF